MIMKGRLIIIRESTYYEIEPKIREQNLSSVNSKVTQKRIINPSVKFDVYHK